MVTTFPGFLELNWPNLSKSGTYFSSFPSFWLFRAFLDIFGQLSTLRNPRKVFCQITDAHEDETGCSKLYLAPAHRLSWNLLRRRETRVLEILLWLQFFLFDRNIALLNFFFFFAEFGHHSPFVCYN